VARRIRAARDLRGLTQKAVVDKMPEKISAAALSQIESGKVRPTAGTLNSLAHVLEVPVTYFSAQWPASTGRETETVFFRDLRSTAARERRRAGAIALLVADLVAAIELHVRLPDLDLPHQPVGPDSARSDIEEAARIARRAWSLAEDEPVPHVVRELERHGVPVARLTIGHKSVDAFTAEFARRPIVLLTDDKSNYVRSRFDAAHELGHLVMHDDAEPGTRIVESQAHDFASAFILPRHVAEAELPTRLDGAGWAHLAELKRTWGISMNALLYRARSLRIITEDTHRNAMKLMSARGWRTTEPGDREMGPPESPLLIERALKRIEVEQGATALDLINEAHLPVADTLAIIKAAVDQRPIVEL
jgi:Zn-dependent peptidase ImmA (M78 family)